MNVAEVRAFVETAWRESIIPALSRFITIPNQSPAYDPDWEKNGEMDRAVELVAGWIREQRVAGLELEVVRQPGLTPLLFVEVPGDAPGTVAFYGHLDKQPPMDGWCDGLGPRTPVLRAGKLYGRGGADDGYAAFAAVTAIRALRAQGRRHARCVMLIEASEESGSPDLPVYVDALGGRIGTPDLVVCLDSGCGNYEQLWRTTSLRGLAGGTLAVSTLTEGVHSGSASGVVPSTFRILRCLLDRLEDQETGEIRPCGLHATIPQERRRQAAEAARVLGGSVRKAYPFDGRSEPVAQDIAELLLNRTWRPQLEITGAAGLPPLERAGNVLRPSTAVKLSLRLPPTLDAARAVVLLKDLLEDEPPYGATVEFAGDVDITGWNAPPLEPWLAESVNRASAEFFGRKSCSLGEGGSIPFVDMLAHRFPHAQFLITGVLGPHSNAHGPNEFLHVPAATKLTACVARVLADHAARAQ